MPKMSPKIYQIKLALKYISPPIWRRILVPGNTNLLKFHDILQIVMGWEDYHLHEFTIDGVSFGDPEIDEYGDMDIKNEANYSLNQVLNREGQQFNYEYDFGDSWDHTLLVEKILSPEKGIRHPQCLKGKRACPPEDVGGPWGYEEFLKAIRNPFHDRHEEFLNWIGGEFDPEAFNLEDINAQLRKMGHGRSTEALNAWPTMDDELASKIFDQLSSLSQELPDEKQLQMEELPLRRDMVTLLNYLGENKITGTQSTGNLTLKAVYDISAQFVEPPLMEETVGDHIYRVRSETEVWPLYFRHILASIGGLLKGGLSQKWEVTPLGDRFLAAPSYVQVQFLLVVWWSQVNWAIANRYGIVDGQMPAGFSKLTLIQLLELPEGQPVTLEVFTDQMLEDTRVIWPVEYQDNIRRGLDRIINKTVIGPLTDFGMLQTEYNSVEIFGMEFRELSTFIITPLGRDLLELLYGILIPDSF